MKYMWVVRLYNIGTSYHFITRAEADAFSKTCGFENIVEEYNPGE